MDWFDEKNNMAIRLLRESLEQLEKNEAERRERMIKFCHEPIGDENAINSTKAE